MLIRETHGLQILMVKRNHQIDFFSGAMVFPGGKVEPQDADPGWPAAAMGWNSTPEEERAPRIAALRETFEECGVLGAAGPVQIGRDEAQDARVAIEAGRLSFLDFVRSRGIKPDLMRLTLFARWLTPPIVPKRFDTFFYLIEMPEGQDVLDDGRETIENEWLAPSAALRLAETGQRRILFPTRMNLRLLSETSALKEAVQRSGLRKPRPVSPSVEVRDGKRYIRLYRDDGYGEVEELI
jgi:8-oxo-dGTP pyrophosphatase MutT (NUDIX family)